MGLRRQFTVYSFSNSNNYMTYMTSFHAMSLAYCQFLDQNISWISIYTLLKTNIKKRGHFATNAVTVCQNRLSLQHLGWTICVIVI